MTRSVGRAISTPAAPGAILNSLCSEAKSMCASLLMYALPELCCLSDIKQVSVVSCMSRSPSIVDEFTRDFSGFTSGCQPGFLKVPPEGSTGALPAARCWATWAE